MASKAILLIFSVLLLVSSRVSADGHFQDQKDVYPKAPVPVPAPVPPVYKPPPSAPPVVKVPLPLPAPPVLTPPPVKAPYTPAPPVKLPPPTSPVKPPYNPAPPVKPPPPTSPVKPPYSPAPPVNVPPPPAPSVKPPYAPVPPVKPPSPAVPKPPTTPLLGCNPECGRRCQLHSRKNICIRACVTCCYRCKCVPPGTYGNRELCGKCYTDMTTHGNRIKCP